MGEPWGSRPGEPCRELRGQIRYIYKAGREKPTATYEGGAKSQPVRARTEAAGSSSHWGPHPNWQAGRGHTAHSIRRPPRHSAELTPGLACFGGADAFGEGRRFGERRALAEARKGAPAFSLPDASRREVSWPWPSFKGSARIRTRELDISLSMRCAQWFSPENLARGRVIPRLETKSIEHRNLSKHKLNQS